MEALVTQTAISNRITEYARSHAINITSFRQNLPAVARSAIIERWGTYISNSSNVDYVILSVFKNPGELLPRYVVSVDTVKLNNLIADINNNITIANRAEEMRRIAQEQALAEQQQAERLLQLEMTMENMEYQVMQVKNQLRSAEQERADIAALTTQMKGVRPELQSQVASLKGTLASMGPVESKNEKLQTELNSLDQEHATKVQELNFIKADNDGIRILCQSVVTKIVEAQDEAHRIEGEIEITKAQLSIKNQEKLEAIEAAKIAAEKKKKMTIMGAIGLVGGTLVYSRMK